MCKQSCGCSCDHQCTCHRSYVDTICPEGFQGSGCILYNGDILKDLAGADYIYSNTSLNTVIKQLWTKILSGSGSSAELTQALADIVILKGQMTTVISNIGTLSNLTTTAKTNLVAAINEIDADLTALSTSIGNLSTLNNAPGVTTQATTVVGAINDRQPVWKKPTTITVGASQAAPFNNLETALTELSKYHFNENDVFIRLEDGTYTLTSSFRWSRLLNERNSLYIDSLSGNRDNVIIKSTANIQGWSGASFLRFKDLTLHSDNDQPIINVRANGAQVVLTNVKITNSTVSKNLFVASDGSSIHLLGGCSFIDSSSANIGFSVFINERNSNILIETASFTLNRPFLSSRSAQMRLAGVTINYTNPLSASLFVITGNSTLTLTQSTAVNTNPNAFESYFIFSDQSNFYISNNYSTSTNVVSGFAYGFVVYNGSNGVIYNTNKNAKYFTKVLCSNGNSKFHMNNGDVKSYNYNVGSMGIYSEMGESSLHNVSIETHRFYQAFNGGKGQFINNEILFNSTFATANPNDNKIIVWEDGGNNSYWFNCNFNLNNSSIGTRTSVNGTQYWNTSTFTNVPSTARLRSDFNSSVYAPLVTGIIKEASSNSYLW
jgi:hypothetical protein